ncbi:uncharacterized protein [Embiotoca jacksoni]|uniref:uncharacterized protein n=2 Tax=Embiotoca jacksoni TaxID=100190 RepID=UPI003704C241
MTQCKQTPVDADLICAAVNRSRLDGTLSTGNSSTGPCTFTITEHACSSATHLDASSLVTLMKCSLESQRVYPVEVWKLFFQKVSPALDQALETFATMAPNNSKPNLAHALEALGEVRIANFTQAQLQDKNFVDRWFRNKIRPFLASPSSNFLFCLSSNNFSCVTYRTVIQALSSQRASMDRDRQHAVFTHFIRPFLSRNDTSDPGCVSAFTGRSEEWLRVNLGNFSNFATLEDLQALNPNFSIADSLPLLNPSQVAQSILSSGASNDTELIDRVFERLEEGDALENVDEFLTQLTATEEVPDFQPVVRDRVMNRTFAIISPHLPAFTEEDLDEWFHVKLLPVLPSFTPMMLKNATSNISCTRYQVILSGIAKVFTETPSHRQEENTRVLLEYLKNSTRGVNESGCRQGNPSDAEWIERNLGPFSIYVTYSELKAFGISGVEVVDTLSPQQKAELILDPDSGALENETVVTVVFKSLTESDDDEQLNEFFEAFTSINKQRNITFIENPGVRKTILNLTLTALAPEFEDFEPEDFQLWFQVHLTVVIASLQPDSLRVLPRDISCASYAAILTGLRQSLKSLPLVLSRDVRSSVKSLKDTFTPDLICAAVNRSRLDGTLSTGNSSTGPCTFTITEHACSSATHLDASSLVTLMKCSLESQRVYPVEVWKLFFQKVSPALDQALETFATMAPNNSKPNLAHALEALGEVRIANFTQAQLQDKNFVDRWFRNKIRPFLASPSSNFLFCLSSNNFSCVTYRTVIQALSSQRASMDRDRQHAVFTHFIRPFLSRNDTSDPGCVSAFTGRSEEWLRVNLGNFSNFATLEDLQALNPNFSIADSLPLLNPSQVAQSILSSGASNDTELIDRVFERLEEGDALENVDEFLTQLTATEEVPDFQPVVRDRVMNRTFAIISPHLPAFTEEDLDEWFHVKLLPVLPSFTPMMLKNATSNISCTRYQVILSGIAKVFTETPSHRQEENTRVLLEYLKNSTRGVNELQAGKSE